MKRLVLIVVSLIICLSVFSQNGGDKTYKFLNIPTSARISALGGFNVSHIDGDLSFVGIVFCPEYDIEMPFGIKFRWDRERILPA